jgi:hypothetical protein
MADWRSRKKTFATCAQVFTTFNFIFFADKLIASNATLEDVGKKFGVTLAHPPNSSFCPA